MNRPSPEAIVIGGSAGAFEALSALLPGLAPDYPLPILIVIHLPPDRTSLFAELFRARCKIRVREAEDKEPIEPGVAYFAPPDYHLLVEDDRRLSLSGDEPVLFSRPSIDVLFESAADAYRGGLIGVVLTGANSDGAQGLKAIVEAGGVAIVQSPKGAYATAMPEAAIAACPEARVLPLNEIAAYLREVGARMTSEIGPVHFLLVDDLEENLLSLEGLLRRDGLVLLESALWTRGVGAAAATRRRARHSRRSDARDGRLRTRRAHARNRANSTRPDHLCHRRSGGSPTPIPGLRDRGGGFPEQADRAGYPAQQGQRVLRALPAALSDRRSTRRAESLC